jgi:hypothetical protein
MNGAALVGVSSWSSFCMECNVKSRCVFNTVNLVVDIHIHVALFFVYNEYFYWLFYLHHFLLVNSFYFGSRLSFKVSFKYFTSFQRHQQCLLEQRALVPYMR